MALEALLRWRHHDLGLIPPSVFIPLAERSGDIVAIGRWVLNEACRIAVTWPSQPGHEAPAVSVNVSTAQVSAGCLVDDVTETMRRSGLPARRLHIELTESLFAGNQELVGPTLQGAARDGRADFVGRLRHRLLVAGLQPPRQGIKPWLRKRAEPVWSPQNSPLRASSFPF